MSKVDEARFQMARDLDDREKQVRALYRVLAAYKTAVRRTPETALRVLEELREQRGAEWMQAKGRVR